MRLSNRTYDKLKPVCLILLPFLTFLAAIVTIWNVPHAHEIAATVAAIDTLIGTLLKLSSDSYHADAEPFENPVDKLIDAEAYKSLIRGEGDSNGLQH